MNKYISLSVIALLLILMAHLSPGQVMVRDIYPGIPDSHPGKVKAFSGAIYFAADDGIYGSELWKYDGMTARRITDINPGPASSSPFGLVEYNGALYFNANDGTHGKELWKYDGTATTLVANINPGSSSSYPDNFTTIGGTLYFTADDGVHGNELWKYNGTTTTLVADLYPGSNDSRPGELINVAGILYFRANDGIHGTELWKHNGTTTTLVADIYPGSSGSYADELTNIDGTLYFGANDGIHGKELWKYNGTTTTLVAAMYPAELTNVDGTLYFIANDGIHGHEIWKTDGTTTTIVTDFSPDLGVATENDAYLTAVGSTLYFQANDGIHGDELWKYDGTTVSMVADIYPGEYSSLPDIETAARASFLGVDDQLYFSATDGVHGYELWQSDGSADGTVMVKDIHRSDGSNPYYLVQVERALYFAANDGIHGYELWKYVPGDSGPGGIRTVIPGGIRDHDWVELGVWARERDWCWTGPWIDWKISPDCGGVIPCPEEFFGMSLKDENQKIVWEQVFDQPFKGEFPVKDQQPYTLAVTAMSQQGAEPILRLGAQLVPQGISEVKMSFQPSKDYFSLQVSTRDKATVPLVLALTDKAGKALWKKTFNAPFEGIIDDRIETIGTTLTLSVAGDKGNYSRTEATGKFIPQEAPVISEAALQVYPNPVTDHTLYLDVTALKGGQASLQILNIIGKEVMSREINIQQGSQRIPLDVQSIPRGVYVVRVRHGQQHTATRILIQ